MRTNHFHSLCAGAAALVLALTCRCSTAGTLVSGTRELMVLQANDATIPEIIDALRSAIHVEMDLKGASSRKLTGRYSGSVHQVLSRILNGEDYVMHIAAGKISIQLSRAGASDRSAVAAPPAPQAWEGSRLSALRRGILKRTSESP